MSFGVAVPARNRVTPVGDVVAADLRGQWMGNRGCIHEGREIVRHHRGRRWIICALDFKGWRAPRWEKGRWTALFFHDEAVALAAGHRPCALCRRAAYDAFREPLGNPGADELDARLHAERWASVGRRLHHVGWRTLPAGAFVLTDDGPTLVLDDTVRPWTTSGYAAPRPRPTRGRVALVTPPTSVAVLAAGYQVTIAA